MCCSESTAVLKAAIQMDHGELLEHVDGQDFYEAQRVTIRNPGKSKQLVSETSRNF